MREEFEKWATEERYDLDRINGKYIFMSTYKAWTAWQARQKEIDALKAKIEELKKCCEK